MIPTKPPPTFREPEKWSDEFRDFVSKCLVKSPEERVTATQLVQVRSYGNVFSGLCNWSSIDVMFRAYKQTWCFIGPICWRDHSLLCNFKIWEYLFGVIVQVRVVFRKTDVGDWRFNYLNGSHLPLTLNMTTAQAVKTAVTNNSLSKDYPHPNDHAKQITDTPGFKPFTTLWESSSFEKSI